MKDSYGGISVSARFNSGGNLELYDASTGAVLFTLPTTVPSFSVAKGHASGYVKITLKLSANTLFFAYVQQNKTEGACWGTFLNNASSSPGIELAGQVDANSVFNSNVAGGRGTVVGGDFMFGMVPGIAVVNPARSASGWFISDINGFMDLEILDSNKASFYMTAIVPGLAVIQSRQIVSGDYA
jgi:hypothetical protein